VALTLAALFSGLAAAATYTLPGALPAGCSSASGTSVTCPSLSLNWGDNIVVSNANLTLTVTNVLSLGGNNSINSGSVSGFAIQANSVSASNAIMLNGNLNATGTLTLSSNGNNITGNVSASGNVTIGGTVTGKVTCSGALSTQWASSITGDISAGSIASGGGSTYGGNLTATSGDITSGSGDRISGSASATSGGVTLSSSGTSVGGSVVAKNAVVLQSGVSVAGSVTSTNDAVTLQSSGSSVGAGVNAKKAVVLGSGSTVTGDVITDDTVTLQSSGSKVVGNIVAKKNVTLANGTSVTGNVTSTIGDVELQSSSASIGSCVTVSSNQAIILGWNATVGGVCCLSGSTCGSACVSNNSGKAAPALCAAASAMLVAHWRFDETVSYSGAAGELKDSAGYTGGPFHGAAIGNPLPAWSAVSPARPGTTGTCGYGAPGGAWSNGGAFSVSGLPVSGAAGSQTSVAFWMYWDGTDSVMPIGWNVHDLWLTGGSFGFNTGNSDVFGIASSGLANGWHHVVAVFTNGSVSSNQLYIDGVSQTLTQRQGTPSLASAVVSSTLRIGGWQANNDYRFFGRIDEVKLFNGGISPAQVLAAYAETRTCPIRPVGDWHLDDLLWNGTTGEALDDSGSGLNGVARSGAVTAAAGKICRTGAFSSATDYVEVPDAGGQLNIQAGQISVMAWIKTARGLGTIVSKTDPGSPWPGYVFAVGADGGGKLAFWSKENSWKTGSTSVGNGNWHHVAAVIAGTSLKFYVDGVLDQTHAITAITGTSAQNLRIGNEQNPSAPATRQFEGSIDEVLVFGAALSASEVASIVSFQSAGKNWDGSPRVCPAPAALIGQYRLDESGWNGVPGEVKDSSGANRHGTAAGLPLPTPSSAAPARAGNPGTCGYAILAGGSGAIPIASLPVSTTPGAKTSVGFWMYWDGTDGVMPIGWNLHDLYFAGGHFGFNTANGDIYGISASGLANGWHHVVAVFVNNSVGAANKLYIDGNARLLTQRLGAPHNAAAVVGSTLQISGWGANSSYRFGGRIDEVHVYDGELTVAEVQSLYSATHACLSGTTPPANFNCVEAGADAASGRLFTKLAGAGFAIDAVALKADLTVQADYAASVKVELVDGAGSTACASRAALSPGVSQNLTFAAAGRKSVSLTVNKAYPDLRCRVTDSNQSPSVVGCSSDNFAVRPGAVQLATTTAMATPPAAASAGTIKTGASFTLRASTTTAASDGYGGVLALDTSALTAQTTAQDATVQAGGLVGIFSPAVLTANGTPSNNANYDEVGYLYLAAGAYRDSGFTAVDQGAGDCVVGSTSVVPDAGKKYGCVIGTTTGSALGRFIPDHFDVTLASNGALAAACAAGGFTYTGQAMGYAAASRPALTITPRSAASGGHVTQNYQGVFQKLAAAHVKLTAPVTDAAAYGKDGTTKTSLASTINAGTLSNSAGILSYSLNALDSFSYTRDGNSLVAPYVSAVWLPVESVNEPAGQDGVAAAGSLPTLKPTGAELRYGRLRLQNAFGSELLALDVPVQAQYYAAGVFKLNAADVCTALSVPPVIAPRAAGAALDGTAGLYFYTVDAAANGKNKLASSNTTPTLASPLAAGQSKLHFPKPAPSNRGWLDIILQVPPHLLGNWGNCSGQTGAAGLYDDLPCARATFGIFGANSPILYRRENY